MLAALAALTAYWASLRAQVVAHAGLAEAHLRADLVEASAQWAGTRAWLLRQATMLDMRYAVLASVAVWALLFSLVWAKAPSERLSSKRTLAELGSVGAKVETCDRIVATVHATVATIFGAFAWSIVGTGVCDMDPPHVKFFRVGAAVTAGFITYDTAVILVADGFHGLRPIAKDMLLHHAVVGSLALYVLTFETMEPMLWFFSVNLFNEISTVFLHLCKFTAEGGYKDTALFKVLGSCLVMTFFTARCVLITLTITLLGRSRLCGIPVSPSVSASIYVLVGTHWLLNMYWFGKLVAMVLRKPKAQAEAPEDAALLADSRSACSSEGAAPPSARLFQ